MKCWIGTNKYEINFDKVINWTWCLSIKNEEGKVPHKLNLTHQREQSGL